MQDIEQRISQFKADLAKFSVQDVTQRHILHGESFILSTGQYFNLKKEISTHFGVNPHDVLIVGSAKLGFSIVPQKLYHHFSETSDIDVVIVHEQLFDNFWKSAYEYWQSGGYWPQELKFKHYLFLGWIRPDKLPSSRMFPAAEDWWEFFRKITETGRFGPYKIRGALYRSLFFLESYQQICVDYCQQTIRGTL